MTTATPKEIVEILCEAMRSGNNQEFINQFAGNGVFEQPFAVNSPQSRIEGLAKLREVYSKSSPIRKLVDITKVYPNVYESKDPGLLTVEFFIEGKNIATQKPFTLMSSLCIIRFEQGKIIHYKDYPNVIGFAKVAGALAQLAASLQ